eukprot:11208070-Lingulodinium_polyedra.AAC.1
MARASHVALSWNVQLKGVSEDTFGYVNESEKFTDWVVVRSQEFYIDPPTFLGIGGHVLVVSPACEGHPAFAIVTHKRWSG